MSKLILALGLLISSASYANCWSSVGPNGAAISTACTTITTTTTTATIPPAAGALIGAGIGIAAMDMYFNSEKTRILLDAQEASVILSCKGLKNKFLVTRKEALYLDGNHVTLEATEQPGIYVQHTWFGLGKTRTIDLTTLIISEGDRSTSCNIEKYHVAQLQQ